MTIPIIKTVHSGNKSLKFQCASLWNDFMRKKIPLQAKPKTYEEYIWNSVTETYEKVNPNLDMKLVNNIDQFKRKVKKHFQYTYTLLDVDV